jgi:phosphorylcholine metabolism protein LicD
MEYSVLSKQDVNDLYNMFSHLVGVLNKYAIKYVCTDGTLLGAIRHGGFIPWDDDIDIAIDVRDVPIFFWLESFVTKHGKYQLKKVGKYLKLKYQELWIDIFILEDGVFPQKHFANLSFIDDELLPLRTATFGNIEVTIPNKAEQYLDRILPRWNEEVLIYNHKSKGQKKMSLTAELRKPYCVK